MIGQAGRSSGGGGPQSCLGGCGYAESYMNSPATDTSMFYETRRYELYRTVVRIEYLFKTNYSSYHGLAFDGAGDS